MIPLVLSLFLPACSPAEPEWVEGGLYVTQNDDGSYSVLKVLKVDHGGVHVRRYSNRLPSKPDLIDESELYLAGMERGPQEELGMGHVPISRDSFVSWNAMFVQDSTVSPEELEGYDMWREADGGYF